MPRCRLNRSPLRVALEVGACLFWLAACGARPTRCAAETGSEFAAPHRPAPVAIAAPALTSSVAPLPSAVLAPTTTPSAWPDLDETAGGTQPIDTPLPFAAKESEFSCAALTKAISERNRSDVIEPVAHLRVSYSKRLWASIGPEPLSVRKSGRSLLLLARAAADGSRAALACAANFGLDLEPGDYFIYGATRTRQGYAPTPGPLFRVSPRGDTACPADLASRGLHDWDGEFPIETRAVGDLDDDGKADLAVDYQYGYTNPGTRLLVARPYPDCLRIVADEAGTIEPLPQRTHGWRDIAYAYWSLHPNEFFGGRMVVRYAGHYDRALDAYSATQFQRCTDGFPDAGSDTVRRERLCDQSYRDRPVQSASELTEEWLSSAPARRPPWNVGELGTQLLNAVDEQEQTFNVDADYECPMSGTTRRFTLDLKLRTSTDGDKTWTRELFLNWELGARDRSPRLASISESSLCPFTPDEADGALEFGESWAARAHPRARVESASVRGCASSPGRPTWLWSALLHSGSDRDPQLSPIYLLLGQPRGKWQILHTSQVVPGQCPLH